MGMEENLKVIDEEVQALNAHNLDRFLERHAESIVHYGPETPEPTRGRMALRKFVQGYLTAFPDFRVRKERIFGQGDWVCGQFIFEGTNKGPMTGPGGQMVSATNKPLVVKYVVLFKLQDGLITERHEYYDLYGMMTQLGLIPAAKAEEVPAV